MADRVSAIIRLGGELPRALFDDFVAVAASEYASTEWDGPAFDGSSIPLDGPLELMAHQVAGGSFDALEAFCIEHGLAFSRSCDAYPGQWSGERLVFEGHGEARSYQVTDDDHVVVTLGEIRRLGSMAAMEAHFASAEIAIPPLTLAEGDSKVADTRDGPTIDMWRALIDFRARHGRYWKRALALKWMNGGDEAEHFSASLRSVRNQFGPSWLYRLRTAELDEAGRTIALLDRLPVMCATYMVGTGEPIVLKRGEKGYWPLPDGMTVERFNMTFAPTPAQIAAMEAGSIFGLLVPAADPANYDENGRPLTASEWRKGGGEGVRRA